MPDEQILTGDCLARLDALDRGCADMVYLDPPFNTRRTQRAQEGCYEDHWPSMDAYLGYMRPRVKASLDVLHENGTILLHCDWRTCHHFRIMLDDLIGPEGFVNHLIWTYGLGGSSPRRFARKHDDILFYARSNGYYFDPPRIPATSARMRGQSKKATDVVGIPSINNMAAERTGYPTQKPLQLLELLVIACSPPGGVVVDPFCGSGTTVVAAITHGRRGIGIDANPDAVRIARARLTEAEERSCSA